MMGFIGNLFQVFSVVFALLAIILVIFGFIYKKSFFFDIAFRVILLHCLSIFASICVLLYLLGTADFSVMYVANHVNIALPLFYRLTSLWAGQAGSMLFWSFLLAIFSVIAIYDIRKKEPILAPYLILILSFCSLFFCLLATFSEDSDPFKLIIANKQLLYPPDGKGLNPLLQHWAMIIHPPILYLGYVSFTVPYGIAMSSLMLGRIDFNWSKIIRRWTLFSWFFLGVGMLLGGKWAYEELGWGGYWAWDPVENAALLPWITGTAFLHSIIVQERRGMLKTWNMVLVSLSFIMCIFGTFLTRSGVVASVHAFASSDLGPYFVSFIVVSMIFSGVLIIRNISILKSDNPFYSFLSREAGFLFNNILLLIILFIVIWGTMYPTITEALFNERISVSSIWFNEWIAPLGIIILFLTGAGPLLAWKSTSNISLKKNFKLPLIVFFVILSFCFSYQYYTSIQENKIYTFELNIIYAYIIFSLVGFVFTGVFEELSKVIKIRKEYSKEPLWLASIIAILQNKRRYVGYFVHISLAILFMGFAGKAFNHEIKITLKEGEAEYFQGYLISLSKIEYLEYKNEDQKVPLYVTKKATIEVYKNNHLLGSDTTEIRTYPMYNLKTQKYDDQQPTSEPCIIMDKLDDIYLQLGGKNEDDNSFVFQIWINPLVRLVWFGFALFIASGLLLLLPFGEGKEIKIGNRIIKLKV